MGCRPRLKIGRHGRKISWLTKMGMASWFHGTLPRCWPDQGRGAIAVVTTALSSMPRGAMQCLLCNRAPVAGQFGAVSTYANAYRVLTQRFAHNAALPVCCLVFARATSVPKFLFGCIPASWRTRPSRCCAAFKGRRQPRRARRRRRGLAVGAFSRVCRPGSPPPSDGCWPLLTTMWGVHVLVQTPNAPFLAPGCG